MNPKSNCPINNVLSRKPFRPLYLSSARGSVRNSVQKVRRIVKTARNICGLTCGPYKQIGLTAALIWIVTNLKPYELIFLFFDCRSFSTRHPTPTTHPVPTYTSRVDGSSLRAVSAAAAIPIDLPITWCMVAEGFVDGVCL